MLRTPRKLSITYGDLYHNLVVKSEGCEHPRHGSSIEQGMDWLCFDGV
jgi:hypothetical protein